MSDRGDFLLYVISAWRQMSWPAFKRAFDTLYMRHLASSASPQTPISRFRQRTVRLLDALGHLDVDFREGGGSVYAAPPLLARLPKAGLPEAVLCGARSPRTVSEILEARKARKRVLAVDIQAQENPYASIPRHVIVKAESVEMLAELASELHIGFAEIPSAWALLQYSGSLQDYVETRKWSMQSEINWIRYDFDPMRLQFRDPHDTASDVRLSSYDDPVRLRPIHYLWRGDSSALVDRDWGRYAILNWCNKHVLVYDAHSSLFIVPSSAPLPRLIARCLALCSGRAPVFRTKQQLPIDSPEQNGFDAFISVPHDIAEMVASKLGQALVQVRLTMRI